MLIKNRKMRKLKNNPSLFFKDFFRKKLSSIVDCIYHCLPKKIGEKKQFTIICAVYNVEDYLDDFFSSVVNQRLDFETNINIILVDDGSPDGSRNVIKKWIKKYPANISYVRKKNGGQASARNLGLKLVKTEWVTFIDPDDFIDVNYFYLLDAQLNGNEADVSAFVTKFKLYKEKFGSYHDGFQTDYCFTKPVRELSATDLEDCVQFSSSSSVYKAAIIKDHDLSFDERLTASFEDTKFFYQYISSLSGGKILYLKDSIYYYRLRANESSSSNSQWTKKAKYLEFFSSGLLEVIDIFKRKHGVVPVFVQRLVLFSVIPYLQVASINKNRITSVLDAGEIAELKLSIRECLDHVDDDVLEAFYNSPGNYYWISAIFNHFKGSEPKVKKAYVNKVDISEKKINLRFYGVKNKTEFKLFVNGSLVNPVSERVIAHLMFDEEMIHEFNVCYQVGFSEAIKFEMNGESVSLFSDFKKISSEDKDFYSGYISRYQSLSDTAVFVDSGEKADDNAEHLYRSWLIRSRKKINLECFYLLDASSSHWERLVAEGFNLLDINSVKAINLIKKSKYIFSSYLPGHLNSWAAHHNFKFQKFIFLQHGVVTSNLSKPFNASYSQIHKMVISTSFEKQEILSDKYNYIFHSNDLIYSGIPRLDTLFDSAKSMKSKSKVKRVLVCPTWRSKLSGLDFGNERHREEFVKSDYVVKWLEFLGSKTLSTLLENEGLELVFCPHLNMRLLIEDERLHPYFLDRLSKNIKVVNPRQINYQELFLSSDLLVTDYSSLHFDFSFLNKPVIYYQFDNDVFYGGTHSYKKGIFNFDRDGFGPVVDDSKNLIDLVDRYSSSNNNIFKRYKNRSRNIFLCDRGGSAPRIYSQIFDSQKFIH